MQVHWFAAVGALALAIPAPARADLPDYDVKAHCAKIAAFGGTPSQMILQSCFQQEQSAYDGLKPVWDSLPPGLKQHCDKIARFGGSASFMILQSCVQQEISASKSNQDFQFKR